MLRSTHAQSPSADMTSESTSRPSKLSIIYLLPFLTVLPDVLFPEIAGVRTAPHHVLLAVLILPALARILKLHLYYFDWFIIMFLLWSTLARMWNVGLIPATDHALEQGITYLVTIAFITHWKMVIKYMNIVFLIVLVLGSLALIEVILNEHFIANALRRIDPTYVRLVEPQWRSGLLRAGVITHPINYGVFCGSMIAMMWYAQTRLSSSLYKTGFMLFAVFLSLSAGPLLAAVLQVSFIAIETATRIIPNRAPLVLGGMFIVLTLMQLVTSHGILGFMAHYATFTADSYWYRTRIWEHVTDDILRSPIIGINPAYWTRGPFMSPSIDAEWLMLPLAAGLPALLFLSIGFFGMIKPLFKGSDAEVGAEFAGLRRGWLYSMLGVIGAGFTVTYYDMMMPHFYVMLAMGSVLVRTSPARAPMGEAPHEARPAAVDVRDAFSRGRRGPVLGRELSGGAAGRSAYVGTSRFERTESSPRR